MAITSACLAENISSILLCLVLTKGERENMELLFYCLGSIFCTVLLRCMKETPSVAAFIACIIFSWAALPCVLIALHFDEKK